MMNLSDVPAFFHFLSRDSDLELPLADFKND